MFGQAHEPSGLCLTYIQHYRYPKDKPLFFQELPNEVPIKNANKDTEDKEGDGSTALEVTKQALGIAKGSAKDAIDKFIALQGAKETKAKAFCKDLKFKEDVAQRIYDAAVTKCKALKENTIGITLGKVLFGKGVTKGKTKSNMAYNLCMKTALKKKGAIQKASANRYLCEQKYDVTILISETKKLYLWGFFWGIKVA